MQDKTTDLSLLSIHELLTRLDDLEKERVRILSQYEPPELEADRENAKRQKAEIRGEIAKRLKAEDHETLAVAAQNFSDTYGPLLQASLPEVPENLQSLPNKELDLLTADVEQRITRFTEFYPNLDGAQSTWVREVLDAHRHQLQEERASRGLPPLARIEASPPVTGADAAKKEPVRNTPRPTIQLDDHEKKIWPVIQRGSKGPTYCRELENAGVRPRRTKFWKDCPGNYPAAYRDPYWRKRVQDEKSRIARKGKLSKTLARE